MNRNLFCWSETSMICKDVLLAELFQSLLGWFVSESQVHNRSEN